MVEKKERGPVRAMKDRIAEMYTPPANVTIAGPKSDTPPRPTVEACAELARLDRVQARLLAAWAADLRKAQEAGDWNQVALVRTGLEVSATALEAGAGNAGALSIALEQMKGNA